MKIQVNKDTKLAKQLSKLQKSVLKALGLTRLQERFLYVYPSKLFNVATTCKAVGIGRTTFYNWMNNVNTFRRFAHDIKEGLFDDIETLMLKRLFKEIPEC